MDDKKQVSTKARNRFVKDHSSEVRKPIQSIELLLSIIMTLILTCRCDRCLNSTSPRCRGCLLAACKKEYFRFEMTEMGGLDCWMRIQTQSVFSTLMERGSVARGDARNGQEWQARTVSRRLAVGNVQ